MTGNDYFQLGLYLVLLLGLAWPLGVYMARIFEGRYPSFVRPFAGVERLLYRVMGVHPEDEMTWTRYALGMLLFNAAGMLFVYAVQRVQGMLPLNPQDLPNVEAGSALNTAASFATNTNWQGYGGECTMSYLTQMLALAVQNFVSAAAGMACLLPLIRGFTRKNAGTVGNFWVDMVRITLYVLLPLSFVLALVLVQQGVPQNFRPAAHAVMLEGAGYDTPVVDADGKPVLDGSGNPKTDHQTVSEQILPLGPAASQVAIKQLGTNGGGYYNVNSAHPYENPTPLANLLETLAILIIGAALCVTFGIMVGDTRQGWSLLVAMTILFVGFLALCVWAEQQGNPRLTAVGAEAGGNMEGKEVRFGVANSALWATATTAASNGSVNAMHDSFTPLGGMVPMVLIQLGEVVYGGVGSGLYGMLAFVLLAVFVAGLMVGRTPEYLGKKIEAFEMKMVSIMILIPPAVALVATALAVMVPAATASVANPGPHGFSEILYAFSSMGNNNGSAFGGLSANTPFYNVVGAVVMLVARYWLAVPILAVAGALARKKSTPAGAGTLATHTPIFVSLIIGVVLLVGALTFLPALALGPIAEALDVIH